MPFLSAYGKSIAQIFPDAKPVASFAGLSGESSYSFLLLDYPNKSDNDATICKTKKHPRPFRQGCLRSFGGQIFFG